MNKLAIFVAVVFLIIGVYLSNSGSPNTQVKETPQVLSEEVQENEEEEQTLTPTDETVPTDTPTPDPTDTSVTANQNVSNFRYPSANTVSSSENSFTLTSTDNPDTITDWYKERIKGKGLGVTSFVTTKTNDNVLNKLVGADGQREVRVEIKKDSGSSTVKISVEIKGF